MADPKLVASTVGMLVDDAAKTVVVKTGANLQTTTDAIREEVKGIEAKLSVLLSNVEGHYESEVALLKLEVARLTKQTSPGFFERLFGRSGK